MRAVRGEVGGAADTARAAGLPSSTRSTVMRIAGNFGWTSSITLDFWCGRPIHPAFLRKSVETAECKRVVKHSWCKERQKSAKEREGMVSKREKWERKRGKVGIGGWGQLFTTDDSMRLLVYQIVHKIVLRSNGNGRLKRKKKKELTQRAQRRTVTEGTEKATAGIRVSTA
jgi:hypothetical protein